MDGATIVDAVTSVTATWTKHVKRQERRSIGPLSFDDFEDEPARKFNIAEAACIAMREAYNKASSNGTYPAHARQIYYAARPEIQNLSGKTKIDSNYFTQTILPDYMAAHPEETADWNIAYDARGHFFEPHTEQEVALGTLEVDEHLREVSGHAVGDFAFELADTEYPTCGPGHRYGAIMFIEKEGFFPLFRQVKLAERYDLAIMSTKGQSVIACRHLVDRICGEHDIPLLVLHDFDHAGFSILGTLQRSNRRYEYENHFQVIDLGLRTADVAAYDLLPEDTLSGKIKAENLRRNGATDEEIAFLRGDGEVGQRVELNAFTSEQMIQWLGAKFEEHGIGKVVPDGKTLEAAYRRSVEIETVNRRMEEVGGDAKRQAQAAEIPDGLGEQVRERLDQDPSLPWDKVIADLVSEETCKN